MINAWSPISFSKDGFLEDENGKFLPKNTILEAFESATIFYYIKRDKEIEYLVKKYLMQKPKIKEISKMVKKIVFDKYQVLEELEIPQKIYLDRANIKEEFIKVFDLEKKEFIDEFKLEVFKGAIDIKINYNEKIKNISKSYSRALAEYEHKALKGSEFENLIIDIQNSIANEWEVPLRVGVWTNTPYKGDLMFFWKIKEIREYLLKHLKIDIRPKNILYIPRTKEFLGWIELRKNL